jgi:hypothetical protein
MAVKKSRDGSTTKKSAESTMKDVTEVMKETKKSVKDSSADDIGRQRILDAISRMENNLIGYITATANHLRILTESGELGKDFKDYQIDDEVIYEDGRKELSLSDSVYKFVGYVPIAVYWKDGNVVKVGSWKQAVITIIQEAIKDEVTKSKFMGLINRIGGSKRVMLSDSTINMTKPVEIIEGAYLETHGMSGKTYTNFLIKKIFTPIGYNYYNVKLILKKKDENKAESVEDVTLNLEAESDSKIGT